MKKEFWKYYNDVLLEAMKTGSVKPKVIAAKLGISKEIVMKVLITEGLWSSKHSDEIQHLVEQGKSHKEIAEYFNVTEKAIWPYIKYNKNTYGQLVKLSHYNCFTDYKQKDIDPLFQSLDCLEQSVYFSITDKMPQNADIFFDDVNIRLCRRYKDGGFELLRNKRNEGSVWFKRLISIRNKDIDLNADSDINPDLNSNIDIDTNTDTNTELENAIEKELSYGNPVTFWTDFSCLKPYCWYEPSSLHKHTNHYSTIIWYDNKDYYIADSPYVFEPQRTRYLCENKTIIKIRKSILNKCIASDGQAFCIDINKSFVQKINIDELLTSILNNYRDSNEHKCNTGTYYIGKKALAKFLKVMKSESLYEKIKPVAVDTYWWIHLIMSQHMLLKNILESRNIIISELDDCILAWEKYKYIVFKNELSANENIRSGVIRQVKAIIVREDLFMHKIEKLLSDKDVDERCVSV